MSDEQLLKEAEKVERTSKDLRKQLVTVRRTRRQATSANRADLDRSLSELDGLCSGVDAMVRALERKYAVATGSSNPSYSVRQFTKSLDDAKKLVRDAKQAADELQRLPGDAMSAASSVAAAAAADDDGAAQQLAQVQVTKRMSTLDDPQLVELDHEEIRDHTAEELRELAGEASAIRGVAEHLQRLTDEQGVALDHAEENTDAAASATERGRKELSQAAKYKMSAMVITAAIVGGVVGGPVGAIAGAKSTAGVLACAAAGSATTAVATQQLTSMARDRLDEEQRHLTAPQRAPPRAVTDS